MTLPTIYATQTLAKPTMMKLMESVNVYTANLNSTELVSITVQPAITKTGILENVSNAKMNAQLVKKKTTVTLVFRTLSNLFW
jgi:hypothetical protein